MSIDCAVLVCTCDAYSDLWPPFFRAFKRHWPDCPFPIYLGTEHKPASEEGVTTLFSSAGNDWSQRLRDHLEKIPQKYVLLMLEDFFLRKKTRTENILHALEFAETHAAVQVRLGPKPGPTDKIPGEPDIGISAQFSPYRLSSQSAIWNRIGLFNLLQRGETIWQFEKNGNQRANAFSTGFYASRRPLLPYLGILAHHVVEKGMWLPHEKMIFARKNLDCDFQARPTLPWSRTLLYQTAVTTDRLLFILPWKTAVKIKSLLKRALRPIAGNLINHLGAPPAKRS